MKKKTLWTQVVLCPLLLFMLLPSPTTSTKRVREETVDSIDGLYFDGTGRSSATSQSKKTRPTSTRWPVFETWNSDNVKNGNNNNNNNDESPNKEVVKPSSSAPVPLADNIKCVDRNGQQSFTATVSPPTGFANVPVFEDATTTSSDDCIMKPMTSSTPNFNMKITSFSKCGVSTQKGNDGKEWLAVSIRFPFVGGLRTSDDEHVMVMCRPQERSVTKSHTMEYRPNIISPPKTIYSSIVHELDTKVLMFAKKSGAPSSQNVFTEELSRNSLIEVGQELQFRAVVRSGDGWKYAKLKDLTIQKISRRALSSSVDDIDSNSSPGGRSRKASSSSSQRGSTSSLSPPSPDSAYLVMDDGCRNPVYAAIAPRHPVPDPVNPLVVNFAFKAFMFQDMMDGDTLRITAKIMACQEQVDCQPGLCLDDEMGGYGKRRRRRALPSSHSSMPNLTISNNLSDQRIHDWTKDFELNVVMPGYAKAFAVTNHPSSSSDLGVSRKSLKDIIDSERKCRNIALLSTTLSAIFVIITMIGAAVVLKSKHQLAVKTSATSCPHTLTKWNFSRPIESPIVPVRGLRIDTRRQSVSTSSS